MAGAVTIEGWFEMIRASGPLVEHLLFGLVVIDARTGRVVMGNPRAEELLGGIPDRVQDLVESGALSRPSFDEVAAHAVGQHPSSWMAEITLHRPSGPSELTLFGGSVEHPSVAGRVVSVLVCERGRERIFVDAEPPPDAPLDFMYTWDEHLRVQSVDAGMTVHFPDAAARVGHLSWMGAHPADLHLLAEPLDRLLRGEARRVEYTVRVVTGVGNWVPAHAEVRRMTDGPCAYGSILTVVGQFRETIADGRLTQRERAVVAALFDGHRVPQIAERDGVSVKTLRNQLTAVYRKLGVADQVELRATYARPSEVPSTAPDLSGWSWPTPAPPGR